MFPRFLAASLALSLAAAGCAKPPEPAPSLTSYQPVSRPAPESAPVQKTSALAAAADRITTGALRPAYDGKLAGRTVAIASGADLALRPKEIILTFDDGPSPTVTPLVLKALHDAGVKAVFFMVGQMADAHPQTAQMVALAGHTIGSHTHDHDNLAKLSETGAMTEVQTGEASIEKAIAPVGGQVAPFFRFPYLAQTRLLRADLRASGHVIFNIDVDSLDYKSDPSEVVLNRTLDKLDEKGGGIVLFHDIHMRTAKLLPDFLQAIKARGYKVVRAVPVTSPLFKMPTVIASR